MGKCGIYYDNKEYKKVGSYLIEPHTVLYYSTINNLCT